MVSSVRFPAPTMYRVEVSGWDSDQNFFVEKSQLEWSEDAGKHLVLSRAVRDRSLLFVRLMQPSSAAHTHPVPYEVEALGAVGGGQYGFRLHPILPKMSESGFKNA